MQELQGRYEQASQRWIQYVAQTKAELERLSRWKHMPDADAKACWFLFQSYGMLIS